MEPIRILATLDEKYLPPLRVMLMSLFVNNPHENFDARNYSSYFLRSAGQAGMDWVMQNTAILHFCGRAKPWKPLYRHRFGILYKHYMQMTARRDKPNARDLY